MSMQKQRGFSTVEYIVVALAIVAAFLLPVVDGQSVVATLVDAIKELFANFSFGISLSRIPTP
jgi:Tfp pilus assembly protein FimT